MDPYPLDRDGFAVHSRDIKGDMKRYNVAVIPVLDDYEQKQSLDAFWRAAGPKINRDDQETWANENWPNPSHPFLITDYAEDLRAFQNRAHPRLLEAFETLHGTDDLVSTIDFYGIKRATISHPEWRLDPLKLHWDVSVPEYIDDMAQHRNRYQALMALNDHDKATGCFSYVPQSANNLKQWWEKYGKTMKHAKYVPNPNPLLGKDVALPMRAGSAVIWDFGVAHSNKSNFSIYPRIIQFCRALPNIDWALSKEPQALPHWWAQHPDKKVDLLTSHNWTLKEKKVLALL